MVENPAIPRLPGPPERSERWTAHALGFSMRLSVVDAASPWWHLVTAGTLFLAGVGVLASLSQFGMMIAMLLLMVAICGGFVLPISLLLWIVRPAQVRITEGEFVVHDLAFNRDRMAEAGFVDGRIEVRMRDGRTWQSRRFSPVDPERLNALLQSLPHKLDEADGEVGREDRHVQRLLAAVQA